jgi:hypothetical protein
MPVGRADTPASDGLLAATLQALDDNGVWLFWSDPGDGHVAVGMTLSR